MKSIHPYCVKTLNRYINSGSKNLRSLTIKKFAFITGKLREYLIRGYSKDMKLLEDIGSKSFYKVLTKYGAFKGPYMGTWVEAIPPNREVRIAMKLNNLYFYEI